MSLINKLVVFLATGFGVGFIKYMPGTFGTLVGVLIYYLLIHNTTYEAYLGITILITVVGVYLADATDRIFASSDNKRIVIDEIAGYLITMAFVPFSPLNMVLGFVLFRFFDITKILGISYIDKHYHNGYGVMGDDVLAGIYAGLVLMVINWYLL